MKKIVCFPMLIVAALVGFTQVDQTHAAEKSLLTAQTIPLLGEAVFVEGIAYSPKRSTYYVSSAVGGSVQTIGPDGKAKWLQTAGTDGRSKALGLKVDDLRDRLWIAGADAVYIYDLNTNKLLKKTVVAEIGNYPSSFLNDLVLDDEGSAYLTDSFAPNVFKVDGKSLTMTHFKKLDNIGHDTINNSAWNLNGIVFSPDKTSLILGKTNDGTLWNLELSSKKVTKIKLSEPVTNVDGLTWGDENTLYAMRNFKNKISKISFNSKSKTKKVEDLPIDAAAFKIPTTAVYLPGKDPQLVVVNSQFEQAPTAFFLTKVLLPVKQAAKASDLQK